MRTYTTPGYLYHDGIKGMKWGVRRYQNKDGTLTEAGKRRYRKDADAGGYKKEDEQGKRYKQNKKGDIEEFDANPDKWVTDDISRTKNVVTSTKDMTKELDSLNKAVDKVSSKHSRERMNLDNMTDKEMRDAINRELLERQYNDVFNPPKVNKGREYVTDVLDIAGPVLGVTASALGIALSIRALMGKG